jgi:hypothetical protein
MVLYDATMSFEEFQNHVLKSFEDENHIPICSLYLVKNQDPVSERTRITSTSFHDKMGEYLLDIQNGVNTMIYFNNEQKSPQISPSQDTNSKNKLQQESPPDLKKKRKRAAAAGDVDDDEKESVASNRTGQTIFALGVKSRDGAACLFCESKENLEAGHIFSLLEDNTKRELTIQELDTYKISGIMDVGNGLTLCHSCHYHFDHYFIGVDPATMRLVVSDAADKGKQHLNDKVIKKRSDRGQWPSQELFEYRYRVFEEKREERRAKAMTYTVYCESCKRGFKTKQGLTSHLKSRNGCSKLIIPTKHRQSPPEKNQH